MSDYQVNYLIHVDNTKAIGGIDAFKQAIGSLNKSAASLENVRRQFVSIYDTMVGLTRKPLNFTITANTREAVTQLEILQRQAISTISTLQQLQQVAAQPVRMRSTGSGRGNKNTTAPIGGSNKKQVVTQTPSNPKYVTPSQKGGQKPTLHEQRTQFTGNRLGAFYSALDGKKLSSSELKAAYSRHSRIGTSTASERTMRKFFRHIAGTSVVHGNNPAQKTAWNLYREQVRKTAASNPGKLWAQQANVPRLYPQSMELQNLRAQYAAMEKMNAQQIAQERKQWRDLRRTRGSVTHPKYRNNVYGGVPTWRATQYAQSQRAAMYPPWTMPKAYSQVLPSNQIIAPTNIPKNYQGSAYYGYNNGGNNVRAGVRSSVNRYGNLNYKLLGPTPLPNNGGMAIDMLKGMGIAYGIAGIGQVISSIVNQATEYDNTMKTVENILRSHNQDADFSAKYSNMTRTVRNVGMETKYTVSEVADAAKFLAMAGLSVDTITQTIQPIADIALVGDTGLGETADLVTNIMTAYKIAPSRMRTAADILTNTFTMSNTTLTEIAEAYQYAAGPLMAGGVDFAEATGAIGVLGDAGNKGSQAGTTMRTILQNIVNPTKKQKKAWDEIGVQRYDSNGKHRALVDIFKDLHNKDLDVSMYYRLFHKTAASGAIALAAGVDKWQNIILENLASGGLSKRLADEKKNTLQGLWAQVKSVFIDRGVTAFEGTQGGIRGLMRSAIDYMGGNDTPGNTAKGDHFRETLHDVSKAMMDFIHTIIDSTKWFFKFYKIFEPMIKVWLRFSLAIWPVTHALQKFSTLWQGLLWLKAIPARLAEFASKIRAVTRATNENTIANNANRLSGGIAGGAATPALYSYRYKGIRRRQQVFKPQRDPVTGAYLAPAWVDTGRYGFGWNKKTKDALVKKGKMIASPFVATGKAIIHPKQTAKRAWGFGIRALDSVINFEDRTWDKIQQSQLVTGFNNLRSGRGLWFNSLFPIVNGIINPKQTLTNIGNSIKSVNYKGIAKNVGSGIWAGVKGVGSGIWAGVKGVGKGIGYVGKGFKLLNQVPGASMVMGGLGAYKAMEQATDDEGSSAAAWLYGGAAVASMFGPYGMAVGAVLGVAGAIAEHYHKVELAHQAAQRIVALGERYAVQDGMLIDKQADNATKYLDVIYSKNRDINKELALRIQQTREALGLESTPVVDDTNGSTDTFLSFFDDAAGKYGTHEENTKAVMNLMNQLDPATGLGLKEVNGQFYLAWSDGKDSGHKQVTDLQAMGNLAMAYEAATGESTVQMRKEWAQALSKAALGGDPLSTQKVIDSFIKQVGNYDLSKIDVNQPFTTEEWKKMGASKFWSYDQNKMVRFNVLWQQLGMGKIVELQRQFQDAIGHDAEDLWEKYAAFHPFLGEGGITLDGDWIANSLGWNGSNFMALDKDTGQFTGLPQNFEELYTTYGALQREMDLARKMNMYSSKNPTVLSNLQKMQEYRDYISGLIAYADPVRAKELGITAPSGWAIKDGAVIPQNQNWYQYNGGEKQLVSVSPSFSSWPSSESLNQLNLSAVDIASGRVLQNPVVRQYMTQPTALPASPSIAQAQAAQQGPPQVNVHIDSAVKIEKLEVRENTDDLIIGQKVAAELEKIIVTSTNNPERWSRVGGNL